MDIRNAIAMLGHIREYIVENQADHEYAEPIDMAIEALKWQKRFDDEMYISKDYHDKVYTELQKRYFDLLERTRMNEIELREYLDIAIRRWRTRKTEATNNEDALIAACYIDAFQSVRVCMLGELLKNDG